MSVNFSQPIFLCDPGLFFSTVRIEFKSNTPCFAIFSKSPFFSILIFKSFSISMKIFLKDGGRDWKLLTEKAKPSA